MNYKTAFAEQYKKMMAEHEPKLTFRDIGKAVKVDHAAVWRWLAGKAAIPTGKELDAMLKALGLEPGSRQWERLRYFAHIANGTIPLDVLERNTPTHLMIAFRSLSSHPNMEGWE